MGQFRRAIEWIATGIAAAMMAGSIAHASGPKPQPVERFVQRADGGVSHVSIHGDLVTAKTIVALVPSLGRGTDDFTQAFGSTLTASLVERGYAVLLIEPRGIGYSTGSLDPEEVTMDVLAGDIEEVFSQLGVERVALVGHAFGNRLSRYIAARNPDTVSGLVLLAAGGDFELSQEQLRCLFGSFALAAPDATRRENIACAFFADGNDPEVWMGGWYPDVARAQVAAAQSVSSDDFKRAGGVPFLLVQPAEDFIAPPQLAGRALAAELGDQVTYVEIEGAGHALLPEQGERVAEVVGEYLDGLVESASVGARR